MSKIYKLFKKNYLLLIAIFSVALGLALTTGNALKIYAETVNAGVLKIEYAGSGPLFNETNIYPGFEITKTVTVTNQGTLPHSFSIATQNTLGPLADVLVIEPSVLGSPVWSKTISDIKSSPDSDVIIGSIAPGGVADVDIRAYLPESVGNEHMGTSTFSFDFLMGNESTDTAEPEEGGDVAVTTDFNSTNVNSSTGTGLNTEEEGDKPIDEVALKVNKDDEGEALGAETEDRTVCFWWWVLLAAFALTLILLGYFNKDKKQLVVWFWPVFAGVALYLIHWIFHDYYRPSDMCPYFIWFELLGLVLYGGGVYIKRSQAIEEK